MRKLVSSVICVATVVATAFAGVTAASAQAAPLPRYLPAESAGYTLVATDENPQSSSSTYVAYFGNDSNTKSIEITADPAQSGNLSADLKARAKKGEQVHGKPAFVSSDDRSTFTVSWIEKGNLFRVNFRGTTRKGVLAFAQNVSPTKKADSSFTIKKVPAGLSSIYIGPESGLIASIFQAEFAQTAKPDNRITLLVANADPRVIKITVSQVPDAVPVTVRGKAGYQIGDPNDFLSITIWEEQPNLVLYVVSSGGTSTAFIEALTLVDEPTWKAASESADANRRAIESGNTGGQVGPPVAAGNVAGIAWAASVNGQCLLFAAGSSTASVCAPGITSPTLVAWKPLVVKQKTLVFGIAGANVATVVAKSAGVELLRVPTAAVADQPGLRYFATELTVDPSGVIFVGLDAAGAEVGPATAAQLR